MVKKQKAKKAIKRPGQKRTRKRAGTRVRVKRDPKVLKRLEELGLSTNAVDEPALSIFMELQQKELRLAEFALLYDAAVTALKAAVLVSDDPKTWANAARQAAGL